MASEEQLEILKQGPDAWNAWRQNHPDIRPNLRKADLSKANFSGKIRTNLVRADLFGANLSGANLGGTDFYGANLGATDFSAADLRWSDLTRANLGEANLGEANLSMSLLRETSLIGANLMRADLTKADLTRANLTRAHLFKANLNGADLGGAKLSRADARGADFSDANLSGTNLHLVRLGEANLRRANLRNAHLRRADLSGVNLSEADLSEIDLRGTNLERATLISTRLVNTSLAGCYVYGMSAWDLDLEGATQKDLIITRSDQPKITVDNIEVAQFIYLMLNNERIRHVIDTITTKLVLILGRFTLDRKTVLDAIREELREHGYLPVLFDFDKPASKDLTGTIQTLASMARFIVADLTEPSSVPHELAMIAPGTIVPVKPILLKGQIEYAIFVDLKRRYHWVLEPYCYSSPELLISELRERVVDGV